MSGRIDYSKWDRFTGDSSDDEGALGGGSATIGAPTGQPRVTRLDRPSKVMRTANGDVIILNDSSVLESSQSQNTAPAEVSRSLVHSAKGETNTKVPPSWTEKGGSCDINDSKTKLYWSQDRSSVTLRVLLPPSDSTKGWMCEISNLLPYDRRHSAVGSAEVYQLRVHRAPTSDGSQVLLEGDLPHPVHANEGETEVDWTIESLRDERYMAIFLNKAAYMQGLTLWWKRPLMNCPEICIDWDRGGGSEAFAKAWNDAHQMFREQKSQDGDRRTVL